MLIRRNATELSTRAAAHRLGVHVDTVQRWCNASIHGERSRLTGVSRGLNGRYRIPASEVDRLLQSSEDPSSEL